MQPAIRVENLSKRYRLGATRVDNNLTENLKAGLGRVWRGLTGRKKAATTDASEFWALKDVSFEVKPGEVVGIIGRNGAGKSTLLKVLSRIVEPTGGRATIRGRMGSLLEVGTGFHPELTGRENIYLNGSILGMSQKEIARKFDEIVAFSGVEQFLDTPVKRYSSGMYVRLAFAVAAHLEPEILIVDEVLAVGDAAFQQKCLGKMRSIASSGVTVLFVSHQMDTIQRLCTKAITLRAGKVSPVVSPAEALEVYFSETVAANERGVGHLGRYVKRLSIEVDGNECQVVPCGKPIKFRLELQDVKNPSKDLVCGLVLCDRLGTRAVCFQSGYHANLEIKSAASTVLTCEVPSLPLVPGQYSVQVNLAIGGTLLERIEDAATIEVVFADYLGTGRLPFTGQGHLVLPASWKQQ